MSQVTKKYAPIQLAKQIDSLDVKDTIKERVCGVRCVQKYGDYKLICGEEKCQARWHKDCFFRKYNVNILVDDCCPKCNFDLYVKFRSKNES